MAVLFVLLLALFDLASTQCTVVSKAELPVAVTVTDSKATFEIHVLAPENVRVEAFETLEPEPEPSVPAHTGNNSVLVELVATAMADKNNHKECVGALASAKFAVTSNKSSSIAIELQVNPQLRFSLGEHSSLRFDCGWKAPQGFVLSGCPRCIGEGMPGPEGTTGGESAITINGASSLSPGVALKAAAAIIVSRSNGQFVPLAAAAVLGGCGVMGQSTSATEVSSTSTDASVTTSALTATTPAATPSIAAADATTSDQPTVSVPLPSAPCVAHIRLRWLSHSRFAVDDKCNFSRLIAKVYSREDRGGMPLPIGRITCSAGRPFVLDSVPLLSKATATTDGERASHWVSQGLGEHASVASFAAFSLQLMINGAPFSLLTGAANANADEVRHAEQSFALASRFAGHAITAEPFPRQAISSMQPQSLEELAEAAFREGCIAETLSVFAAARQVDENDVVDDEERNVLTGIVRDEARHSALAWRTIAWATGTAQNAALNERLMQIAIEESKRCTAQTCGVFERLIVPLSKKLVGTGDWQRVVESEDVNVEFDPSRTLAEATIVALTATLN